MKLHLKYSFILIVLVITLILPICGSYGSRGSMPDGYGLFPCQLMKDPPGFSLTYFISFSLFALFLTLFLVFPRIFGFKKSPHSEKIKNLSPSKKRRFPWWFWGSLTITFLSWALMWAKIPAIYSLTRFSFVPLGWGFIFLLDGIVFYRTKGHSLVVSRTLQFKVMILVSMLSWFLFEYFNYFVNSNWYYPNYELFTSFGNIVWFFLGYSTVLPVIFEWYTLLMTFPKLSRFYSRGPKISPSRPVLWFIFITGLALFLFMSIYPYLLFWAVWVALIPVFGSALALVGKKTVLSEISVGDWSKVNLIALATILNGFFWELWNFGSEWFHDYRPVTPGFWKYSVPYVDAVHIFSEMPILGYYGYLFFGVNCWILWNLCAYLLKFDDKIDLLDHIQESHEQDLSQISND